MSEHETTVQIANESGRLSGQALFALEHFRGSNSFFFISAFHLIRSLLLKKRICSPRSKLFPLRVESISEGFRYPGRETGSHKNCVPLKNDERFYGGVPLHLKKVLHVPHTISEFGKVFLLSVYVYPGVIIYVCSVMCSFISHISHWLPRD